MFQLSIDSSIFTSLLSKMKFTHVYITSYFNISTLKVKSMHTIMHMRHANTICT